LFEQEHSEINYFKKKLILILSYEKWAHGKLPMRSQNKVVRMT